jgi:PTS system mannose-specific IIA component
LLLINCNKISTKGGGYLIGILIVTHGNLGTGLIESAEIIMGKQSNYEVLSLKHNDSVVELQKDIQGKVQDLEKGGGVLILTDIFGGSPSNSVALALRDKPYRCLTGVNMPMLLEALALRDSLSLNELTQNCQLAGVQGIKELYTEFRELNGI